jgi:hypothetical protein
MWARERGLEVMNTKMRQQGAVYVLTYLFVSKAKLVLKHGAAVSKGLDLVG